MKCPICNSEMVAIRYQYEDASGWVCAWSLEDEPWRVALMKGEW